MSWMEPELLDPSKQIYSRKGLGKRRSQRSEGYAHILAQGHAPTRGLYSPVLPFLRVPRQSLQTWRRRGKERRRLVTSSPPPPPPRPVVRLRRLKKQPNELKSVSFAVLWLHFPSDCRQERRKQQS